MRVLAIVAVLAAAPVSAASLSVIATGTVRSIDGLDDDFAVGESFALTFDFDTAAPVFSAGDLNVGDYRTAGGNVRAVVGDYVLTAATGGVRVIDYAAPPTVAEANPDQYDFAAAQCRFSGSQFCDGLSGATVFGGQLSPVGVYLIMKDPTRTAFGSDAIPTSIPPLSGFPLSPQLDVNGNVYLEMTFANISLGVDPFRDVRRVFATVESVTVVPIPAAVWLFASALAGLTWLRRR
jgi:hypothetical protein